MIIKKINEEFDVKIDTNLREFNCVNNFKLFYFTDANKTMTEKIVTFAEVNTIGEDKTSSLNIEVLRNSKTIEVKNGHIFVSSDIIKIKEDFYIIKEVNGNVLTLNLNTIQTYGIDTIVDKSHLTGIYYAKTSFDTEGIYTLIVQNIKTFKSFPIVVKIVKETLNEKIDELKNPTKTFV